MENKSEQVFDGRLLKVFVKNMRFPNGYEGKVEYIKHPGAVMVIPECDNGSVIMIKQFRPVLNRYIWEFPAGTIEPGERPSACVRRELVEETGYKAGVIKRIGYIFLAPGYSTEKIIIYKAAGLKKVTKQVMEDEIISEKVFSKKQVVRMAREGKIVDAKTLSVLAFL